MGCDGIPAACYGIGASAVFDGDRSGCRTVGTDESIPGCVKRCSFFIYGEIGVVIPAFSVLGLVIDRGSDDLNLARGEIPLVVRHVIQRVPQAEFHIGINLEGFALAGSVLHSQAVHFAGITDRNKVQKSGSDAVL